MRRVALVVVLLAVLPSCADDDAPVGGPVGYTCDLSQTGQRSCTHFRSLDEYGLQYNEWYCGEAGGLWRAGFACPAANRVASCEWPEGVSLQIWYAGATALADVEEQCRMYGGAWTTY